MASDLQELRIVRRPEVLHLTGLSRATLYRLLGQGRFPCPVRLSTNAIGWREAEVRAWLESREPTGAEETRAGEDAERGGGA